MSGISEAEQMHLRTHFPQMLKLIRMVEIPFIEKFYYRAGWKKDDFEFYLEKATPHNKADKGGECACCGLETCLSENPDENLGLKFVLQFKVFSLDKANRVITLLEKEYISPTEKDDPLNLVPEFRHAQVKAHIDKLKESIRERIEESGTNPYQRICGGEHFRVITLTKSSAQKLIQTAINGWNTNGGNNEILFTWNSSVSDLNFADKKQADEQFKHYADEIEKGELLCKLGNKRHYSIQNKTTGETEEYYTLVINAKTGSELMEQMPNCPLHFSQNTLSWGYEYWFKSETDRDHYYNMANGILPDEPKVSKPSRKAMNEMAEEQGWACAGSKPFGSDSETDKDGNARPVPEDRSDYLPPVRIKNKKRRRSKNKNKKKTRRGRGRH